MRTKSFRSVVKNYKAVFFDAFGVLKNHPIQQSSVADIYKHWQSFFDSEEKHQFLYNKGKQDGYFPQSVSEIAKGFKKKDIKEYFHYYPWGQCPEKVVPWWIAATV